MKLAELLAAGAFVPREPVAREIKWKMGDNEFTATVFIKCMSVGDQERVVDRFDRKGGGGSLRYKAATISALVGFGDSGEEQMTVEQADSLHINLADALMEAIADVNGQYTKKN